MFNDYLLGCQKVYVAHMKVNCHLLYSRLKKFFLYSHIEFAASFKMWYDNNVKKINLEAFCFICTSTIHCLFYAFTLFFNSIFVYLPGHHSFKEPVPSSFPPWQTTKASPGNRAHAIEVTGLEVIDSNHTRPPKQSIKLLNKIYRMGYCK